jgi:ABC-type glycerol-3-phosphate transport system substrate-binding protein
MRPGRLVALVIVLATALTVFWPSRDKLTGKRTLLFTVWGAPFEDALFRDRYARGWEQLNPDVRVDYRRYGDDITAKYNAWHVRGRGPEVMRIRVTDYKGMAARGLLLPLNDLLAPPAAKPVIEAAAKDAGAPRTRPRASRPPPALRIRPGLRKPVEEKPGVDPELLRFQQLQEAIADVPTPLRKLLTIDGLYGEKVYALPEDNAQYGLFYNRALFVKHNRDHPNDQVNFPPADGSWTWEDLRKTAIKLTKYEPVDKSKGDEQPRIVQAGLDFAIWSWPFMTFFAQAGGELWSPDELTCTINTSPGVETLNYFRRLQREDRCFNPSLSGYQSGTGPDALFAAGRTAMLLDGSWRVPNLELVAPDLDFAVAPLPRGKVPAVVSGCVMWAISANAQYADDAWEFLRWLVAPEQAIEYWETLRVAPPASLEALASPRFQETPGLPKPGGKGWEIPPMSKEHFELRASWMRYANETSPLIGRPPGFVPVGAYQTELEEEITRMLNEWLNPSNNEDARTVLDRVADHMHRLIDRDREAQGLAPVDRSGGR